MRKNYPLRIDAEVFDAMRRWAYDDLRSLNGQIEYLLREALRRAGRELKPEGNKKSGEPEGPPPL
ncbi:MAG TPA: hypothetical protein VMT15_03530 [Bryobacteraceae bacterium]|nr:hypothetical protein [Bryobacteraceae bacterium]